MRVLAANPRIEDLALTTNGVLLAEQAEADKANEAGREWEELVQVTAHSQPEESDGDEKYRTKI